jgi:hypothetical protein
MTATAPMWRAMEDDRIEAKRSRNGKACIGSSK